MLPQQLVQRDGQGCSRCLYLELESFLFNHHLHQSDHVSFADPAGCSSYGAPHATCKSPTRKGAHKQPRPETELQGSSNHQEGRKSLRPTLGNPPEEGNLGQSKNKAPPRQSSSWSWSPFIESPPSSGTSVVISANNELFLKLLSEYSNCLKKVNQFM